ncbi:CGNR zinc finger domain-containing protein [Sulfobacillus harzensis]|uniref:Zinc finger CGNR domain-containing protein n=1 Tax=Sulfobacillus harzensis TaxID=2729629 RepID=A0A7Y0L7J0_9FIRM|nr:ABATE domain-containing protein [Sulfobacillus harzensis]NMP24655.1 hypothetical protein [Sulfobacillus harzensis]
MDNTPFEFIGGSLCLDFANTVGGARNQANATDQLTSYTDLLHWSREAGLIGDTAFNHLQTKALNDVSRANDVLAEVKTLREAIYRIFSDIARGNTVDDTLLLDLNKAIGQSFHHARIVRTPDGYAWGWKQDMSLDTMEAPIVRSAADLLTAPSTLSRIRECASDHCTWLFLDETKNRSRRWCNMRTCGNASKVHRYRARHTGNAEV